MTLNEIAYSILSQTYNFNISDDIDVDLDWIYWQIEVNKNAILKKKTDAQLKSGYELDIYKYQYDVNCIKLDCIDVGECCEIDTDCKILKAELPTTLLFPLKALVSIPNKKKFFEYVPVHLINSVVHRRVKIGIGYWYYMRNKIYVLPNIEGLEYISINGVFEQTSKLNEVTNCSQSPCFVFSSSEYPIDAEDVPVIENIIIEKIRLALVNVKDLSNNALDDAINTIKGDMQRLNNQLNTIDQSVKQ